MAVSPEPLTPEEFRRHLESTKDRLIDAPMLGDEDGRVTVEMLYAGYTERWELRGDGRYHPVHRETW